jgi:hypothetical protein
MEPRDLSKWRREPLRLRDHDAWLQLDREIEAILKEKEAGDFLDALARPGAEVRPEPRDDMESYFADKLSALGSRVAQLSNELERRRQLKEDFLGEIDYQIGRTAVSLETFRYVGVGYKVGLDIKRNFLERQLADLRERRRRERLRFWEHVVALRRDLREASAEYQDLKRRPGMLEGKSE